MSPPTPPHVLWIYGEDLGPHLGCYGEPAVETPNIDRLAAEGVRYENAFVTCPVCSPSRSAIMTGCYQTRIGAHHHRSNRENALPGGIRTIPAYFRDAGYFTCNSKGPPFNHAGKTDLNFDAGDDLFDGVDWSERADGQPFYAQCNITCTHRMERTMHGAGGQAPDGADVRLPPYYPDHPVARRDWALYLESIQRLDEQVGTILDRLAAEGLAENTIVVFLSDHGPGHVWHKQFCWDGGLRIPLIVRAPGRVPAGEVRDELVSAIDLGATSLALAGRQVPAPMDGRVFLGDDRDPERAHIVAARDRCDEAADRIRAVRTQRWKYIRNFHPHMPWSQTSRYKEAWYPVLHLLRHLAAQGQLTDVQQRRLAATRPVEELYDLEHDPHETTNLADHPDHRRTLQRLRNRLQHWIRVTGDRGHIPEPAHVNAHWETIMIENYSESLERVGIPAAATDEAYLRYWWDRFGDAPLDPGIRDA